MAWVKDQAEHNRLYSELINVTEGIKNLGPELLAEDSVLLAANSAPGKVITKMKSVPGCPRCIIVFNHSNVPVTATFTLKQSATSVRAHSEARTLFKAVPPLPNPSNLSKPKATWLIE